MAQTSDLNLEVQCVGHHSYITALFQACTRNYAGHETCKKCERPYLEPTEPVVCSFWATGETWQCKR